jgi:glucokinase
MFGKNAVALGVDIGGTNTKLGLVDNSGNVSSFRSFPSQAKGHDPHPYLETLSYQLSQLIESTTAEIVGIGICTHGYIDDQRRGPIICESTPAIRGFDLSGWASGKFKRTVLVSNDLAAHALAEYYFGSGRGTQRFMAVAVGTGVGAGLVLHGKSINLAGGTTGDTGRIILDPTGPLCAYGIHGSAEAYCGTPRIEFLAEQLYGRHVPAFEVIRAARTGTDPLANKIIQEIGEYLGWMIASLCAIFLPERVALTGGTAEAGDILLRACRRRFADIAGDYQRKLIELSAGYYRGVEITLSHFRGESGVAGAVVEVFQLLGIPLNPDDRL